MEHEKQLVLVVEDQDVNRKILRRILQFDYNVIEAENGQVALAMLRETSHVSAILLDIVMPVMDGYEFLCALKDTPFTSLPVIAVTATKDSAAEQKALDLGAWDFISKPYVPKVLMTRLKNVIVRSQFYLVNEMRHVYEHDALTDLYNRASFFQKTTEMLERFPERKFALLRFDIDNFHLLNSFWGEEEGNRFLRFIAEWIRQQLEPISTSTFGRINADTFGMCLPYDPAFIDALPSRAREELAAFNRNYLIKPSMGVYVIEDAGQKIETMYEWATLAARACKGKYESYISYYSPELSEKVIAEQRIVHEMQDALDKEEFEVYLQPKYNLETEQPYGAEALVRWRHPTRGLLSPGLFIPVFERNGFIGKIDQYMWEKVCQLLRRWQDEGRSPAPISVNVSRVNMYNPNLAGLLTALVRKYGIDPKLLNLELTESAYMDDPDLMKKTVLSLQNAGFVIMMDDFGSDYSSLNTLKDIPVDVLKIDMNFLSSTQSGGRNECILASVIRMAGWLGIPVIMEGVETLKQIRFLRSVGCGYVQGYYYAKPMPVSEYDALVSGIVQRPVQSRSENHEALFQTVWVDSPQLDLLFNSLRQPAAVYEFSDGSFQALRINTKFYTLFGNCKSANRIEEMMRRNLTEEEYDRVAAVFRASSEEKKEKSGDFTVTDCSGRPKQMHLDVQYWGRNENSAVLFALFSETGAPPVS